MSAETAVAPAPKLELEAAELPVVEGKTSDEVKTGLEKAAKQGGWQLSARRVRMSLTPSLLLLLRLEPARRQVLLLAHCLQ